jgi:tetratricopeptide (TPR) repeat protein
VRSTAPLLTLALTALLLGGCSIYSLPGSQPAPAEPVPGPAASAPPATAPQPAPQPTQPSARAAYQPLLDQAEQASAQGDYNQALALLERAQRIDSDSAEIYLAMAQTHQARGDLDQARATAERGMLYCSGRSQCDALRVYVR